MPGLIILFLSALVVLLLLAAGAIVWQVVRPRRRTFAIALAHGMPTEPADLGLQSEEVLFNLPDNHTTPGWVIAGDKPDGPTVVVLHGHHDARFGSLLRAQQLARYAAHVVVFDWPSHGECTAPWMTCGVREPGDALAVVEGLPDAVRDRPIVLFGYSLGGQIAVKTAAVHPRFAGVIVDGAYRYWDTPIRLHLRRRRLPVTPLIHMVGVVFHFTRLIQNFDRAHYARQLEVPLLVLHGTDDRVCPIHEGKDLADHAPNSTFIAIEDGRHNRLHEHDPDTYHAALDAFFQSLQTDKLQA